ncbi:MAG: NAD-dependent epimerase/dehydratase family protein, partial [Rhizobium sp.]
MNPVFQIEGKRIWVAGHRGMVGSALVRVLSQLNCEVLTTPRSEVDLTDQAATRRWVLDNKPDAVIVAAARVGGIAANSASPVAFLYD